MKFQTLEGLKFQALEGLKFQALEGLKFQNKQTQKQMIQAKTLKHELMRKICQKETRKSILPKYFLTKSLSDP